MKIRIGGRDLDLSLSANRKQLQSCHDWEKQVAHLRTLQKISQKLNSKLDLEDAMANVLDEAIRVIGAERGSLLLVDSATGDLTVNFCRHLGTSDLNGKSFQISRTVIERVWRTGQPVLTANALEDPRLGKAESIINYTLRSILCVPLHLQEQRIGVLYLDNRLKAGQFHEEELSLAVAIADQAAIALRNAQLHQEAIDRARKRMEVLQRIQSLNQISFKVRGSTNFFDLLIVIGKELEQFNNHCHIVLISPDQTHLELRYISPEGAKSFGLSHYPQKVPCVSVDDTVICRQVLQTRSGRFISNLNEVMRELVGRSNGSARQPAFVAPLLANNQVIGLLIMEVDHERLEDPSLLMIFANQLAATIEMSRLQAELQRRLAELQSVLAITRAMVSEISLDNLLEFIMFQAEHLTNAEGAAVLLLSDDGQWLEVAAPTDSGLRMKAGSRLLAGDSLAGLAITNQRVQVSNHAQDDHYAASIRDLLKPTDLRSLLCAPLVAQGKSLGAVMAWNKRGGAFNQNDDRLMGLFADEAALTLHNARLHARNHQLAIEQERHRLARDLHDSVTQSLYSIALAAQTSLKLLDQAGTNSQIRTPIEHIQTTSQIALAEMREQLYDLHPTTLVEHGLSRSLAIHCDALMEKYLLPIEFTTEGEPPLSTCQREALYYIARESLWNIIKHANATHVEVSLARENNHVRLSIVDDGAGFDPSVPAQEETIGLRNMEERAKMWGGTLELETKPGQGTRVTARLPIQTSRSPGNPTSSSSF